MNAVTLKSKTVKKCPKHIEDCEVGLGAWLVQNLRLRKDFDSVNYQIHAPSSNESDEDDFDCGAFTE